MALSRLKQGFESPRERQSPQQEPKKPAFVRAFLFSGDCIGIGRPGRSSAFLFLRGRGRATPSRRFPATAARTASLLRSQFNPDAQTCVRHPQCVERLQASRSRTVGAMDGAIEPPWMGLRRVLPWVTPPAQADCREAPMRPTRPQSLQSRKTEKPAQRRAFSVPAAATGAP